MSHISLRAIGKTAAAIFLAVAMSGVAMAGDAPDRVVMLPQGSRCHCWRLGNDAPVTLEGAVISTPSFNELQTSAPARAALWRQICTHEHDFFPQPA